MSENASGKSKWSRNPAFYPRGRDQWSSRAGRIGEDDLHPLPRGPVAARRGPARPVRPCATRRGARRAARRQIRRRSRLSTPSSQLARTSGFFAAPPGKSTRSSGGSRNRYALLTSSTAGVRSWGGSLKRPADPGLTGSTPPPRPACPPSRRADIGGSTRSCGGTSGALPRPGGKGLSSRCRARLDQASRCDLVVLISGGGSGQGERNDLGPRLPRSRRSTHELQAVQFVPLACSGIPLGVRRLVWPAASSARSPTCSR
jgi:hypothetical protein